MSNIILKDVDYAAQSNIIDLKYKLARLIPILKCISLVAGNLPDLELESKTGANDAKQRGLMVIQARDLAKEALKIILD